MQKSQLDQSALDMLQAQLATQRAAEQIVLAHTTVVVDAPQSTETYQVVRTCQNLAFESLLLSERAHHYMACHQSVCLHALLHYGSHCGVAR